MTNAEAWQRYRQFYCGAQFLQWKWSVFGRILPGSLRCIVPNSWLGRWV